MPQCTHLFLKHTRTRTRIPPACPLTWVTAARWWMVSCMCTQRGALWKSETFVRNHSHAHALSCSVARCSSVFRLSSHILLAAERLLLKIFYVTNRSTELDLPYPDLQEYIADMNVMMALIINGPVYVRFNFKYSYSAI